MRAITVEDRRAFANWARARGAAPNVVAAIASVSWEDLAQIAGRLAGYTLHEAFREAEGLPVVAFSERVFSDEADGLRLHDFFGG